MSGRGHAACVPHDGERRCRICGCTEWDACADLFGDPCHWVEADPRNGSGGGSLCSACAHGPVTERDRRPAAFAGPGAQGFVRGGG